MAGMTNIGSLSEFRAALQRKPELVTVVHFSADWSEPCGQLDENLKLLADQFCPSSSTGGEKLGGILRVEAERVPEASLECGITAVPTVLFFQVATKFMEL